MPLVSMVWNVVYNLGSLTEPTHLGSIKEATVHCFEDKTFEKIQLRCCNKAIH